jgi:PAS domain S-box-containing protein
VTVASTVRRAQGHVLAVALSLATILGVRALDGVTDVPVGLEPFLLPIALSAFFGGLGPGLTAIALSAVGAACVLSADMPSANGAFEWAGMLAGGGLVVGLLHRARSASRLAASREQHFTTITATAMDGIVTLDEAQRVTSFNAAAERMFGIRADEILGHRLDRLLPDGCAELHARHVEAFGRSGVSRRQLGGAGVLGRRATGELFPIDLSISQAVVGGRKIYTGILRDVTERTRAERTLRETASQLQLFIENAPAAIAMFDREMRYLFASRRWITDFRLAWPDVAGRSHYEIFPEIPARWREIHRRCLEGAVEACEEDCFPRADGTVDWIAWEVRPWFDADGRVGGIIIMSETVTARRLASDALRDSEERWRSLVETMPDAIYVNGEQGITYINQRGLDLWRARSADEILGRSPADLLHPDAVPELHARMRLYCNDGDLAPTFETRARALDGTILPIESTARVRIENGHRIAQVLVRDISERKKAEEQLRFQSQLLRDAGRIAQVGGWTLDVTTGEVTSTEEVWRILESDPASQVGLVDGFASCTSESRARLVAAIDAAVARAVGWDFEIEIRTPSGTPRWARSIGHPVCEADGRVLRLYGALQDVTAQHEAAAEIRRLNEELEGRVRLRTAELEAANRELESFSYSVSHDLRAPLRTMDGFAEMIVEDYAALLPPDGARRLQVIRQRAQHMGVLIDDLLKLSRLGREPLYLAEVDMRALVEETLAEQLPSCGDRRIEVEIGALPACRGDRGLLKQVWVNLTANALKYTRRRDTAHVSIGSERAGDGPVAYFVRDDGTGFDMADASKLFGVFQRLHRSDEFEGTGVGLAIVQRIVQRHDGRVWCDARPGDGAAFFFTVGATRAAD